MRFSLVFYTPRTRQDHVDMKRRGCFLLHTSSKKLNDKSGRKCPTYSSFAIGDEVDGEDVLQLEPGGAELELQSTSKSVFLNLLKLLFELMVISRVPGTGGKL